MKREEEEKENPPPGLPRSLPPTRPGGEAPTSLLYDEGVEVKFDPNKAAASMRKEYDFTGAKRAKDVPHLAKLQAEEARGKTRITILIDDDVLAAFRARVDRGR